MHSVDAFISTLVAPAGQRVAEQASRLAAQHEHTKALPRFHTHAQARTHAYKWDDIRARKEGLNQSLIINKT